MKYFIVSAALFLSICGYSQQKTDPTSTKPVCPVCKTDKNTIPVVYGKPATATIQRAERGEIKLGGCVIGPDAPGHYCKKDEILY